MLQNCAYAADINSLSQDLATHLGGKIVAKMGSKLLDLQDDVRSGNYAIMCLQGATPNQRLPHVCPFDHSQPQSFLAADRDARREKRVQQS